ncbi:MAG: DUF4397 domain-containing protein [Gemmatimonadaceae bacterium]
MNRNRLLLGAIAMVAGACGTDTDPVLAPTPPIAYVRYVHAVADTGATDWRPIDALENSPPAIGITFRQFTPYQAMGAGNRRIRIFPSSTDINITQKFLIDTTISFTANTYYTLVHTGLSRAGASPADRILVVQDPIPETNTTQVAVRVLHHGASGGTIDAVGVDAAGATSTIATGIAYAAASNYAMRAPGPVSVRVTASGTTTPVLATAAAPAGAAADPANNLTKVGGATIAGSALTAIWFDRSVAGSAAPAGFTTPAVVYLVDRHPK